MPIMDSQLLFSESQDISGAAASNENSSNEIYLPQVLDHKEVAMNDRPNVSGRLFWNCVVEDTDLAAAGDSCALTFELYNHTATGAVAAGSVIDTVTVSVNQTSNYPDGSLVFSRGLPQGQLSAYFEVKISRATQDLSTGAITMWIGSQPQIGG